MPWCCPEDPSLLGKKEKKKKKNREKGQLGNNTARKGNAVTNDTGSALVQAINGAIEYKSWLWGHKVLKPF